MVGLQAAGAQASPAQEGQSGPAAERPHNGTPRSTVAVPTRSGRREAGSRRLAARPRPGISAGSCRRPPGPSRRLPSACPAVGRQGRRGMAVAHPAHHLDRARREGLRGVRSAHRRERVSQRACLPHRCRIQSALSRIQSGGHEFLCRLRRPALHAAGLLRLEERSAVLLLHRRHAARLLQGHPLHRAGQRHLHAARSGRNGHRRAQGAAADRRHHLLRALPLPAQLHGQAAARPLPGEDFARQHQARHHHLRSQRPRGRDLQGVARGPHPLHRHASRQLAHARASTARLSRVPRRAWVPASSAGVRRRWWVACRPPTAAGTAARSSSPPTRTSPTGRTSSSSAPSPSGRSCWSAGKFVLESETLEYYDYVRRRLAQRRLQVRPAGGDALHGALAVRGPEVPRRRRRRRRQGRHPQAAAAGPASQQHLRHRRRLGDLLHALA